MQLKNVQIRSDRATGSSVGPFTVGFYNAFVMIGAFLLLASCAHGPNTKAEKTDGSSADGTVAASADDGKLKEPEVVRATDPEPPNVVDEELETIPTDYNEKVQQWLNYFQGKGRPHMERYLSRMPRYGKIMKKILHDNGLPEDLIYIALIESGFSPRATSHAAAVGYWQFIRGTGRRYGLEINSLVDDRRDPILSTQAAAEYFRGLYSVFGSWYLAMASYNVGENRIKKEVLKGMTRDFWTIARARKFPKETKNYIPKFIAAKMIAKDPEKYGFKDLELEKPIEFELVRVTKPVNLRTMATKLNFDYDDFKALNPKFRGEIAPLKEEDTGTYVDLRIPIGMSTAAQSAAAESAVDHVELIADAGETETYKVHRGESLYTIARKFHTGVAVLRDLNDLTPGRRLRIGMRLQVPERGGGKVEVISRAGKVAAKHVAVVKAETDDSQKATEETEVQTREGKFYIVQPGDTLSQIADDYDCTINEIRKLNALRRGRLLKVGMRLKLPSEDTGIPVAPDSEQVVPSRGPQAVVPIAHVVKPGETLASIARKYGVSVKAIKKTNRLKNRSVLRARTKILIPVTSYNRRTLELLNRRKIYFSDAKKEKLYIARIKSGNAVKR